MPFIWPLIFWRNASCHAMSFLLTFGCLAGNLAFGQGVITTVAGTDLVFPQQPQPALSAPLGRAVGVALDQKGNLYFPDYDSNLVMKLDQSGIITIVAGTEFNTCSGDGGSALRASIETGGGVAEDRRGNLFVTDTYCHRIRKITPEGIITTVAGNGIGDFSGDGGPATEASLNLPGGVTVDTAGNVFISDNYNNRVRRVTPDGIITTVAGDGSGRFSGDGGPATKASLYLSRPDVDEGLSRGLAVDPVGNVYIADTYNHRIRRIAPDGTISTIAGTGRVGSTGDGGSARSASLDYPTGLTIDTNNNLFISDRSNRIRKVTPLGTISTVVGNGSPTVLSAPAALTVDLDGNLFVADTGNNRIILVAANGTITTIAGKANPFYSGDGGAAVLANLYTPLDVAVDTTGHLFIADTENNAVRMVASNGIITTVAGNGVLGSLGDGGLATNASLENAVALAFNTDGDLFIVERHRIRRVTQDGIITTVAGNGQSSFYGDGGPATEAAFTASDFAGIAVDTHGNIFVSDSSARVREVTPDGIITTVAGNGMSGFSGDGGPAINASLYTPSGIAVDAAGNLFISDSFNNRIRKVTPDGIITTVAGNGMSGFSGDGGPATSASLQSPGGLRFDTLGNLFVADTYNHLVRKIAPDGTITTVAGSAESCSILRDGGLATNGVLCYPQGVAADAAGNLFIADSYNNRVRAVLASPPALTASPQELSFLGRAGGAILPTQIITVSASVSGVPFGVSVTTSDGGAWLSAEVSSGNTARVIEITVDPFALSPGQYSGSIVIQSSLAMPSLLTIPVSLTVGSSLPPLLSVDRTSITFTLPGHASPRTETIRVKNSGGGSLDFAVSPSTDAGGTWLTISPQSSTATPSGDVIVVVRADPTGLPAGTYTGKIVIAGPTILGQQIIPVTMTISNNPSALLLSQGGLSFTAIEGGGVVPPQNFGVLNLGSAPLTFSVETSTLSGGSWLSAIQETGASTVDVSVDAGELPAGQYYGLVQVKSPGAANSPQLLTSHLEVLPRGTDLSGVLQPNELSFNAILGRPIAPSAQSVLIYNLAAAPKVFRTTSSDDWIGVVPNVGIVTPDEPVQILIQPFLVETLLYQQEGTFRGTVTLQFDDGRVRTVRVTLVVAAATDSPPAASGGKSRRRAADGACQATELLPAITSLGGGFSVPAGWPVALQVQVQDDCGVPLDTGSVVAEFSNGDPPLPLLSLKAGRWDATWQTNRAQTGVTITVRAISADGTTKGLKQLTGGFGSETSPPVVTDGGISDAASGVTLRPISPGALIAIAGDRLADETASSPTVPWSTSLANTSVLLAGRLLPVAMTSPNQIVAIVPYGVETNTLQQLLLTRGTTYSQPVAINLADTSPAVFVKGGQGYIIDSQGNLVAPGNAARAGDVVSIFSNGLGALQSALTAGDYGPSSSATVNGVAVSIGGKNASVSFSGLAPGLVGMYLVTATVPDGVDPGDQVPVSVTSQTQPPVVSPAVTMAIKP